MRVLQLQHWLSGVFLLASGLAGVAMAQDSVPLFERAPCPFEEAVPDAVECGWLTVPENRSESGGRNLRLAVAVTKARGDSPRPDPLVFLTGGPGQSGLEPVPRSFDSPFWSRFREDRDIVFIDQRGTGYSDPEFCPELDVALYTAITRGLSVGELRAYEREAVLECRERMLAAGIDFSAYNSAASAQDLDDLRQALGYDEWNLFGASYGTRLALTAMRDTPEGIRSVVIDSVYPPNSPTADMNKNLMRSLRLVFDQCAEDPRCHAAYPTLEADFFALVDALEAQPVTLEMTDHERFPGGRIVVDGTLLATGVYQGLYDNAFVPFLPLLVDELKSGNEDLMFALADSLARDPHEIRQGLYLAVECFERIPFASAAALRADSENYPQLAAFREFSDEAALCEAWHAERASDAQRQAVESDIPALVAAGEFDPITPPAYARLAADTLPNATLIEAAGRSHGVLHTSECTLDIMQSFLDDPSVPPDTSCVASLQRDEFITSAYANPGIYRLVKFEQPPVPAPGQIALVIMLLLVVSAIVVWPLAWLIRRIRRRPDSVPARARQARILAFVTALLVVVFFGGLAWALAAAVQQNFYLLAVGVPESAAPIFLLPWLIALFTVGLGIYCVLAWKNRWWSVPGTIYYSLVVAACAGILVWAARLGLMAL